MRTTYQESLRKETSQKFSRKDVNTSLLMFPVRLETKFKMKSLEKIHEPDRVYYTFCELWAVLRRLQSSSEERVLQQMERLQAELERLDIIYKEDKGMLRMLMKKMRSIMPTVDLCDRWTELQAILDDVTVSCSVKDNESTLLLNEMDHYTRLLVNTCKTPPYSGYKRLQMNGVYSQTVKFRMALKHYRQCYRFILGIEGKVKQLPAFLNKKQYHKFERLIEQWAALADSQTLMENFQTTMKKNTVCKAQADLQYFVQQKLAPCLARIKRDKDHLLSLMAGKLRRRAINPGKPQPYESLKRYTVLATMLMSLEIKRKRGVHLPDLQAEILRKVKTLADCTYFRFECERTWVGGLFDVMNRRMSAGTKVTVLDKQWLHAHDEMLRRSTGRQGCPPLRHYGKKEKVLCVRIYPDVLALTQSVRQLTKAEYETGKDFWLKYIFSDDTSYKNSLWAAVCDLYPPHRAAFILRQTFPSANYHIICRRARQFHDDQLTEADFVKEIDENFLNSFPTTYVDNNETMFTVPATNLLPDRFILQATLKLSDSRRTTITQYGHRLPTSLQVGIDMNNLENAASEQNEQLYLNGSLRWMTDYDEAEHMGMAITLPLEHFTAVVGSKKKRVFQFDSIFVYGVHEAPADECSNILQQLFDAHLYSEEAIDLIPSQTATNILTDDDEGYAYDSGEEAQRERFKYQAQNCVTPYRMTAKEDLKLLNMLFCMDKSVLGNIKNPSGKRQREVENARMVNSALLSIIDNAAVKIINNTPLLRDYFVNDVLPRGPFPMIRISNQPYGILPACDFKHLNFSHSSPLWMVRKLLLTLTVHWNSITRFVEYSGGQAGSDADTVNNAGLQQYLAAISCTPASTSLWKRKIFGDKTLIDPAFFRGEKREHQLAELLDLAHSLGLEITMDELKSYVPHYNEIPLIPDDEGADTSKTFVKTSDGRFTGIIRQLRAKGITTQQLSDEELNQHIIEFFDLFAYRLDCWLMGLLSNKIRTRMEKGTHRIALGCFGWIFNLEEPDEEKNKKQNKDNTNEYILAPSVNHAITGAVLRSAYVNTHKDGDSDYQMSVNLSSERVRKAIRMIEGLQNGLSVGSILGCDFERAIHDYPGLELDVCIYELRKRYPLVTSTKEDGKTAPDSTSVVNGAKLLDDYRQQPKGENWISGMNLFKDTKDIKNKEKALLMLIDRMDDEYDALTDVILSEGVYKLTQGNTEAVNALNQAMQEMRNIPRPEVTEIPITSAQIDGRMVVALDVNAQPTVADDLLAATEPKVDAWFNQMLGDIANIDVVFRWEDGGLEQLTLKSLGVSASALVYLSANRQAFVHYLETLYWLKEGVRRSIVTDGAPVGLSLDEVELAVENLRELMTNAAVLKNDDLVKETGLESHASYTDCQQNYYVLKNSIELTVKEMVEALNEQAKVQVETNDDYDRVAMDDAAVTRAVRLMARCFKIGQTDALDMVSEGLFTRGNTLYGDTEAFMATVESQHAFYKAMQTKIANLTELIVAAEKMVEGAAEKTYRTYADAIRKLLLSNYMVVPVFSPDDNVPVELLKEESVRRSSMFTNINAIGAEEVLADMARVEKPMMHLHQLRLFAKCNFLEQADVVPMQIPVMMDSQKKAEWLGAEVKDENHVHDAFTYLVMNPQKLVETVGEANCQMAGIVLDHWVERIPYREQTAAMAFNCDQPDAEAPQTLLLAVSTKDNASRWSEEMLLNALKSAIHMVKCRAVEPDMISNDAWASGIFPLIDYKDINK